MLTAATDDGSGALHRRRQPEPVPGRNGCAAAVPMHASSVSADATLMAVVRSAASKADRPRSLYPLHQHASAVLVAQRSYSLHEAAAGVRSAASCRAEDYMAVRQWCRPNLVHIHDMLHGVLHRPSCNESHHPHRATLLAGRTTTAEGMQGGQQLRLCSTLQN
jgi:hypothetical protein